MKPERWHQISHLYHSAAQRNEADRAAYLTEACAGDPDLRREVESLLAHQDGACLLDSPALDLAASSLAPRLPNPLVGRKLGPYQILAPLGAGGMGEVYRARDAKLGREVALKVLPEAFARDPERLARFRREAQLLAALNHPNIAAIYSVDEANGVPFLVLELVAGDTLAERLAAGAIPIGESLRTAGQIAEALEAAHEKGIIHRDLKPSNVKLTPDGKVKVLDFGLAKALEIEPEHPDDLRRTSGSETHPRLVMGTPAYMSPEQARGKPVDRRTDIWAFGCLIYECLAGKRPFSGETGIDVLNSVVGREPDWCSSKGDRTRATWRPATLSMLRWGP
jgi:serine/threonine protein kinase